MSLPLFGKGMRASWKLLVIFAAVLALYYVIIIWMFDPELGAALEEFAQVMPELMAAMGMGQTGSTLVDFMANYLYGFLMLVFPMVYAILTANRLVARQVDRGSMACLLAAPVSRLKIVFTQFKVLATGLFLLVGFCAGVGLAASELLFPGELDVPAYLLVNLGVFALQLFIGGICFFASCLFNDTKASLALGAGLPVLCYIIQMVANVGGELENAKYATFFTLYSPADIIAGEAAAFWSMGALAAGALVLYAAAMVIFCKKDIPV